MTQKELLYVEDAIGHEQNIMEIIENTLDYLEDENLVSFLKDKLDEHKDTKESLIKLLEEKADE